MTPRARELRRASHAAWLAWLEGMDDPALAAAFMRAQREEIAHLTAEEDRDMRLVLLGLACVFAASILSEIGAPALVYQALCWGGVSVEMLAWGRGIRRRVELEREIERCERDPVEAK